jgi:hypothetical protein
MCNNCLKEDETRWRTRIRKKDRFGIDVGELGSVKDRKDVCVNNC